MGVVSSVLGVTWKRPTVRAGFCSESREKVSDYLDYLSSAKVSTPSGQNEEDEEIFFLPCRNVTPNLLKISECVVFPFLV